MSFDPSILLKQLGLSGRTAPVQPVAPTTPAQGAGSSEFADLLQRARDGTLSSNRPVTLAKGLGLDLSDEQLARLSLAADRAEASGLRTALVMIDDQRLVLDVTHREIVSTAATDSGVLEGIDGVIDLAGILAPAQSKPALPGPPTGIESPSLARLLARQQEQGRAA